MNRRNFIKGSLFTSALSIIPGSISGNTTLFSQGPEAEPDKIFPNRLKSGDTVGLIAPGFLLTDKQLETSAQNLRQLGFNLYYTSRISGKSGYFSGTDKERVQDIHEMFANPAIKGVICAGGGYGCTRILNLLDYSLIGKNPKVLMGFSDVTALLNAVYQQTGLVTFHGPVARTIHRPYNTLQFRNVVMYPKENYLIESTADDLEKSANDPVYERYTITQGKARGRLAGGNLSLLASMVGTRFMPDLKGKILFLEEIDEEPYRIDRMLTQLLESGNLQQLAGIAMGIFKGCNKATPVNSFTVKEVIADRLKPLNIPTVYGLSFGHNINNCTLPVGLQVELNADCKTLKFLEKAVL